MSTYPPTTTSSTTGSNVVDFPQPTAVQRVTLVRGFELPLEDAWDGRTLDVRIVPYGVQATVSDPPDFRPYREMFMPGVFERQLTTPGRDKVWLNVEHEQGFRGAVGRSLQFRDQEDGLHGSFGVDEGPDGDKALRLVTSGFLTGMSLEFHALASKRVNGVVQRLRAQLDKVSLCRYPAYPEAQVIAVREEILEEEEVQEEEEVTAGGVVLPDLARSEAVDQLLSTLGVEPLTRITKTSAAWDGSPGRFTDEQYQRSCLIDRGGDASVKERCSLPVLEPSGALNVNALGPAAAALAGARGGLANVSQAQKATAARKLLRYYNAAGMEPPESIRRLAGAA